MCYFYKSSCLQWLGKYTESASYIDKCLELLSKMNMDISKEKADCLVEKCYNFFKIKLYLNSVQTGRSALDVYKKANLANCFAAGRCLRYMAESSGYLGVSSDFVNYYKQALDIFTELNNHKLVAFSLKKLSAAYGKNDQRDMQLKCALKALESYQNPLVIDEWKDTEEMANTYVYLADAYRANCNLLIENYESAKKYYELALKFYKNNDNKDLYEKEIRKIREKISSMRRGMNNPRTKKVDDLVFSIRRLNL
jgi:tetratricopeptide (TPR) repeat protein